ncbi:MAG: glutaredoxin [Mariprofundaceae bacterium]
MIHAMAFQREAATSQRQERPAPVARQASGSAIHVMLFRWAGHWGPFSISVPCGECALTGDVIEDVLAHELAGVPVRFSRHDWLSEWWRPLMHGGWHAPIVMVEGKVVSQGAALNRGVLAQAVIEAHARSHPVTTNVLFGKHSCPHCQRARAYLNNAGIDFAYRDVVREPAALYEMLTRIKPLIGARKPITVPQIWLDGVYIGGADALADRVHQRIEPNPERGQCSLSPSRRS